jgi:hypothetical protein
MKEDNWHFLYWDEPIFKKTDNKENKEDDKEEKEVD